MPEISVLLPVRDGARTLGLAMLSVLRQSYRDFELLVIDDGSRDASPDIARSFGDARVRLLLDGKQMGLAARLNQGIDEAVGRYIARMDADDICFPERFARQFARLENESGLDLLGCRTLDFDDGGAVTGERPYRLEHEALCARPWNGFYLVHPSWMGRTAWFRRYRYRTPALIRSQDQELLLRAYQESRYAVMDEILLGYRATPLALSKRFTARRCLFGAQMQIFAERREWAHAALVLLATGAKVARDLVTSALPGRGGPQPDVVSPEIETAWKEWLQSLARELEQRRSATAGKGSEDAGAHAS